MSNPTNEAPKTQKPVFSYARAAQGSGAPTPTANSPVLNGRPASVEAKNGQSITNGGIATSGASEKKNESTTQPSHSSKSSISSISGAQSAWNNKAGGVHMPARGGLAVAGNVPVATSNASVTFGNFANPASSPAPPSQGSNILDSNAAASGG